MLDWLNPAYTKDVIKSASHAFAKSGSLQLQSFLSHSGLKQFTNFKWKKCYNPLEFSYSVANPPSFVFSPEFKEVISNLTGRKVKSASMFCFQHGDYSLLFDDLKPQTNVVAMLDLFDVDELAGGWTSFLEDGKEVFRVVPKRNALTLVSQNKFYSFTKYVNHHASNHRVMLYLVLQ